MKIMIMMITTTTTTIITTTTTTIRMTIISIMLILIEIIIILKCFADFPVVTHVNTKLPKKCREAPSFFPTPTIRDKKPIHFICTKFNSVV